MPRITFSTAAEGAGEALASAPFRDVGGSGTSSGAVHPSLAGGVMDGRISDTIGFLFFASGQSVLTGAFHANLVWIGGERTGVSATVAGNNIALTGGTGDALPADDTAMVITAWLVLPASIDGGELAVMGFSLEPTNPEVPSSGTAAVAFINAAGSSVLDFTVAMGEARGWDVAGGATNPIEAWEVASIRVVPAITAEGRFKAIWGSSVTGGSGGSVSEDILIEFDEPSDRPAGPLSWPVQLGIPFGNGARSGVDGLAVAASGGLVPAQIASVLPWRFGNIDSTAWVHCDFLASLGGGTSPAHELRQDATNPAPGTAVTVTDNGTTYTVATGAVTFVVHKTAFNLFESFTAGGNNRISSSAPYWKDSDGNTYDANHVVDSVVVEQSGPIKAVLRIDGKYQKSGGRQMHRYQVFLTAWAGSPYVRCYHRLILDQNLTLRFSVNTTTNVLTTVAGIISGAGVAVDHAWLTGDPVRFSHSHQNTGVMVDLDAANDASGTNLPTLASGTLNRTTDYFVRAVTASTVTIHPTAADATNNVNALDFTSTGTATWLHYLTVQKPLLSEYGLRCTLNNAANSAVVGITDGSTNSTTDLTTATSITVYQSAEGTCSVTPLVGSPTAIATWSGLLVATNGTHGLAVGVRDAGYSVPKQAFVDANTLTVKFWAGSNMVMLEESHVPASFLTAGHPNYQKENLIDSGEANPFGIVRTHEVWFWPADTTNNNRLANDLVQRPPAVTCPEQNCASEWVQGVRPRSWTPAALVGIETSLENMARYRTKRVAANRDYNEWTFGNLHLFDQGPFRYLDNNGYNSADLWWFQFYRSGRRYWLEEGTRISRNFADVGHCNLSQTLGTPGTNFARVAGRSHVEHAVPWGVINASADSFTDFAQHLLLQWLLTGYEPARDALQRKCDERAAANYGIPSGVIPDDYNPATQSRTQYGAAFNKSVYWKFTGIAGFRTAWEGWTEIARNGVVSGLTTDEYGNATFPNNNEQGFFYEALRQLWYVSGDDIWAEALRSTAGMLATVPASAYAAPDWALVNDGSVTAPELDGFRHSRVAAEVAYRQTGIAGYLQEPLTYLLREGRVTPTSGDYLGYHAMQGTEFTPFSRAALVILGAANDAGWPAIVSPINYCYFHSRLIAKSPWISQLTMWIDKLAGAEGHLHLFFKNNNLHAFEVFAEIQAVVLAPDGTTTTTQLTAGSTIHEAVVTLASGASGIHRIMIQGKCAVFTVAPTTDMLSLVIETTVATRDLQTEQLWGPVELFARMQAGVTSLAWSTPSNSYNRFALPAAVLDSTSTLLGRMEYDGASEVVGSSGTVTTPAGPAYSTIRAAASELIVIGKGRQNFSVDSLAHLPTIRSANWSRHIAIEAAQHFEPMGQINADCEAFYRFEEAAAPASAVDAVDATSHGRTLTHNGLTIVSNAGGRIGSARQFVAADDHFFHSDDVIFKADGSFTIWGWLINNGGIYIAGKHGDWIATAADLEWGILTTGTNLLFSYRIGSTNATLTGDAMTGSGATWRFICARYDRPNKKIYLRLNGAADVVSGTLSDFINSGSVSMKFGGVGGANNRSIQGLMDGWGFAKRLLTDIEVTRLYNDGEGYEFPY